MTSAGNKVVDEINYWIAYVDCALAHPCPMPRGKHVYHSDLKVVPEIRDLYDCLYKLYSEENASEHFREPVDALRLGILNYYTVITEPMSLRTVLDRITQGGHYSQAAQVMSDVDIIWSNCEKYNGVESTLAVEARKCKAILADNLERLEGERPAPGAEVDRLVTMLDGVDESVLAALEAYFKREDPTLILGTGDVDLSLLRVKHVRAMKEIVEQAMNGDQL
uniref:Uncharacterized protein TCIL3000_11_10560 n=2 Tax=Trypanosoma congolense (strain IL3000) TaxID=1068625 RepID=G0V1R2_TRYCI|nr:unnamed protein product [Trypanosoma congolense IL3000]